MRINTLMSIIIGIWKVIGDILSLGVTSVIGDVLYAGVSSILYFYYLAIAIKYENTKK